MGKTFLHYVVVKHLKGDQNDHAMQLFCSATEGHLRLSDPAKALIIDSRKTIALTSLTSTSITATTSIALTAATTGNFTSTGVLTLGGSAVTVNGVATFTNNMLLTKTAVTQDPDFDSDVTINARAGVITTVTADTGETAQSIIKVLNNTVLATSIILAQVIENGTLGAGTGTPILTIQNLVAATSFDLVIHNVHLSEDLNAPLKIAFVIL